MSLSRVWLFATQGLQPARLPCPLPSPGACSNSCPLSWWCHPTISPSVGPFSSCLQSFPASGAFLMSWLLASGGQSTGLSASVLPMNIQDWFPSALTGLSSLQSQGLSSLVQHHCLKASVPRCSAVFMVQLSHPYMTTGRTITLTIWTFIGKVMSLLFKTLSSLVIAFLPRSKCLNFMASVTIFSDFGAQENKACHYFHCFPIYSPRAGIKIVCPALAGRFSTAGELGKSQVFF